MARLDRAPRLREIAQLGSVLGREFAYDMISALAGIEEQALQSGLSQLVADELLYQRGRPPRSRYLFKQSYCPVWRAQPRIAGHSEGGPFIGRLTDRPTGQDLGTPDNLQNSAAT